MLFLHQLEAIQKDLNNRIGLRFEKWPVLLLGLSVLLMAFVFMPATVSEALAIAFWLAPMWLPILLVGSAYHLWYILKRSEFIAKKNYILLELKPPRTLVKTPLAMEAFLSTLHLTGGESTWWQRFQGGIRPYFSLEIASFEGEVHFFIWGRAELRRLVESQLYAQYPGMQIIEAPDYTRMLNAPSHEWSIWGCDFKHTADNDALPIKTYVEYGLDKVQKEPEQTDPLANLIEFMASVGKGEYLWLQFVIRAHKGEKYGKLNTEGKVYTWKDQAKELIMKIRETTRDTYIDIVTGEERPGFPNPTKGQLEKMAAIDRNVSKLGFDVGARCIYLARPENFYGPTIAHMIALFKPFSTEGWNGINSTNWMKKFDDYPWEIGVEKRKNEFRHELVEAYRRRQFFYDPFFEGGLKMHELMVMSTEELATIFHIPSRSVETPGLNRVHSATGDAPTDLPI
ncbi:MAG: hypothetical protein AAB442_02705 [Patescibacteria group bacterium]